MWSLVISDYLIWTIPNMDITSYCIAPGYVSEEGSSVCTMCPGGTYTSNNKCEQCPANTFSSPGSSSCTPCPDNQVIQKLTFQKTKSFGGDILGF